MPKKEKPTVLVTNDDSVHAAGLQALIDVVRPHADVVVVAPWETHSGMSHAITIKVPLRLRKMKEEPGLKMYACNGTPADCVKIALNKVLDKKPDMVVSGINHGNNASVSVFYSGTMAAAIEGCLNGIKSVGFSFLSYDPSAPLDTPIKYASKIFRQLLKNDLPGDTCLNVNIPDIPAPKIKGIRVCSMARGAWKEEFDQRKDPAGRNYYWLTGSFHNFEPDNEQTDEWALNQGYVSITPISTDLTAWKAMNGIKKWNDEEGTD